VVRDDDEDYGGVTTPELTRWLRRIERKLDSVTTDHERRIRRLEVWVYVSAGAGGVGALNALQQWFGG